MDDIQIKCFSCYAIKNLFQSFSSVMYHFCYAKADLNYFLFKTYCMSVYGSQLWNYDCKHIDKFCRCLLGLPYRTHCNLVHLICKDVDIDAQLHKLIEFVNSCMNSKKKTLQLCYSLAIKGSGSCMANIINYIASVYKVKKYNMCSMNLNRHNIDINAIIKRADAIRDFIPCVRILTLSLL